MMSIKLFVLLKSYGLEIIDQYVTRQYDLTRDFYKMIQSHPRFRARHEPMSNILCFRFVGKSKEKHNFYNAAIRKSILENGRFYIVQTTLNDEIFLRVTIMSPHTTHDDLQSLIHLIIETAENLGAV